MSPKGTLKLSCSDAKVTVTGMSRTNAHVYVFRQVTTKGVVFGQEELVCDLDIELPRATSDYQLDVDGTE